MASRKLNTSIPLHPLKMDENSNSEIVRSQEIFSGNIEGLTIIHKVYSNKGNYPITFQNDCAVFFLVLKGNALLISNHQQLILEKETLVAFPDTTSNVTIEIKEGESLHLLEFTKVYSIADKDDLSSRSTRSDEIYFARFQDCEAYTEKIKSPNTISRTVLPGGIIPRVALGTVEAMGPDKVGEHSHPMLEQLFLGLEDNSIVVYADNDHCEMGAHTLLHIPLGSTHCVEVMEGNQMNYMWMDFFLTKSGEEWLDTHKPIQQKDI